MCDCIRKANKALAAHNTAIDSKLTFSADMKSQGEKLFVPTRKINAKGKRPMTVWANFCPLCGEKSKS
jgi:hypothetical protein